MNKQQYRKALVQAHPDNGGSLEEMQTLRSEYHLSQKKQRDLEFERLMDAIDEDLRQQDGREWLAIVLLSVFGAMGIFCLVVGYLV